MAAIKAAQLGLKVNSLVLCRGLSKFKFPFSYRLLALKNVVHLVEHV